MSFALIGYSLLANEAIGRELGVYNVQVEDLIGAESSGREQRQRREPKVRGQHCSVLQNESPDTRNRLHTLYTRECERI